MTYVMPPEWAPHERTWMAWPGPNPTFSDERELAEARTAWASVAHAVRRHEPLTMVVGTGQLDSARALLSADIGLVERDLDDAWMRDIGPTFVKDRGSGELAAVDWVFNGWGAQGWARWEHDCGVARHIAGLTGVPAHSSPLVNEGGGIHVDGEGTVLLTETVQLDPDRNQGWTKEQVEAEIHARIGTTKAIWLPRGLTGDYGEYGTRGHVDIVAAFAAPGVVLVHSQRDPAHPDFEVSREIIGTLTGRTDARGRPLEIVEVPAPTVLADDDGWVDHSYINHYLCNDGVVLCAFDDPRDEEAAALFRRLFPARTVTLVDARTIFAAGGGIHCVTQQQPVAGC
ncbi:agmatine/peptidylarginine deiminase [Streptomyces sp. NPDC016845]|uniref:agmatine/peptidylarginine deiminase n=1 Tax=Streptomyces sp. NPDC016845 TaxID=3364972 RepID=UPI0037A1B672